MIKRDILQTLMNSLDENPAVGLLGPRQVGKTTLALELAQSRPSIYLDLQSDSDRAKLSDPESYLSSHEDKLVILDEIQTYPDLFKTLRGLIDKGRRKGLRAGRFLLLGSASLDLLKQSGESLAGRISYLELGPLNSLEVDQSEKKLWLRGGFPDSLLAGSDEKSMNWRNSFIRTYLERDIPQLGPRIPAETLKRFWTMLAHRQMSLLSVSDIAKSLAVDGKTVSRYLDLMVDVLLVRKLQPWHGNLSKRLVKSPKVFIRDSGLCHSLLQIQNYESLLSHPVAGGSWEAHVIENLISLSPPETKASFFRTAAGAEIDLVLEIPDGQRIAIEVKRSLSPKLEKGFFNACEDLKPNRQFVIYPGNETYRLSKQTQVLSLKSLCEKIQKF